METPTPTSHGKKNVTAKTEEAQWGKRRSRKEGIPAGLTRQQVMPAENWWKLVYKAKIRDKKGKE